MKFLVPYARETRLWHKSTSSSGSESGENSRRPTSVSKLKLVHDCLPSYFGNSLIFFEFLGFYSNYDFFLDMMCGWKLIRRDNKADILKRAQALHNDGQLSDFSLVSSVRVRLVCFPSVMDKYFSFWSFAIVFVCGGYQRYKPNCCARCAMILKFLILDLNFALV